jgi:hypothetical protein
MAELPPSVPMSSLPVAAVQKKAWLALPPVSALPAA